VTLLRTILFNLLFYPGSVLYATVMLPCLITRDATHWGIHIWTRGVLGLMRYVLGLDYRVIQTEKLPVESAIYACKHQSAWETIAMWIIVPRALFVMKRELYWLPVIGLWIWRAGNIGIKRSAGPGAVKQMLREAKERVDEGYNIIIFPEGTRVRVGETRPYLPGVSALYKYLKLPVVPIGLNSGIFWPKKAFLKKAGIITVTILPPIPTGVEITHFLHTLQSTIEQHSTTLINT
jgi:1-acyl-sn-glycerol-3-phosphate acyltransferase